MFGLERRLSLLKMSDDEILSCVSEHTGELKQVAWLKNIRLNQKHLGFTRTVRLLRDAYLGQKAVVIGAGPAFKRFGTEDLAKIRGREEIVKIACDGALQTLYENGVEPDIVASVDCHPVVANFYRRTRFNKPPMFLLSTTVHRDVVTEIVSKYGETRIFWWQAAHAQDLYKVKRGYDASKLYVPNIPAVYTGGNVGTTCFVIASQLLGCRPIGLLGLEFAWSDETPYSSTQYYEQILKLVDGDSKRLHKHFIRVMNRRDGKTYIADPVYFAYSVAFRGLWGMLHLNVRRSTFNLTKQGILSARGLKTITMDEFIEK